MMEAVSVAHILMICCLSVDVAAGFDVHVAVWKVTFPPLAISGACTVTAVLNKYQPIVLNDVLFGDVWVCSGQSNMEFSVARMFDSHAVAAEAAKYAKAIRFMSVGEVQAKKPLHDLKSLEIHWAVPDKSTVWPFSAVCWLHAKNIYDVRGVPMGLIESVWGGTNIETWSSPECLDMCNITSPTKDNIENESDVNMQLGKQINTIDSRSRTLSGNGGPYLPNSALWNAMIHPLLNMTIYGVLWYQGEANTIYNCDLYNCTFPALITDWRQKWFTATNGLTDPFGFVQIGPNGPLNAETVALFADLRWHQTADIGYVPNDILINTFMAVSIDLTDQDVHYRDKTTVSHRLALAGLSVAYNIKGLTFQGPRATKVVGDLDKHLLNVFFDNRFLAIKNISGFEVCCQSGGCAMDGMLGWFPAPVIPLASSANVVTLNASLCTNLDLSSALRYGWHETPFKYLTASIYSLDNNLPAPPFIMYRPHSMSTSLLWYPNTLMSP